MADRERYQLVVGLGEGDEGQRAREVLDKAAEAVGKPVTVWARETLLTAAGHGPADPIAEVLFDKKVVTQLDLRSVAAMRGGYTYKVDAMVGGQWYELTVSNPDALMERWKRVKRA
jgi:hypothetical protein